MKARRVLVALEVETDVPLSVLRNARLWTDMVTGVSSLTNLDTVVHQAQANVVRDGKPKARKKRRKA